MMRNYVDRWTASSMEGDTFLWVGDEDPQLLGVLMRYWLPVSRALTGAAKEGPFHISPEASNFSDALVHALLVPLAARTTTRAPPCSPAPGPRAVRRFPSKIKHQPSRSAARDRKRGAAGRVIGTVVWCGARPGPSQRCWCWSSARRPRSRR